MLGQQPSISSIPLVKQQTYFMGKLLSLGQMGISRWLQVQVQTLPLTAFQALQA
jgi:hypothetical protein